MGEEFQHLGTEVSGYLRKIANDDFLLLQLVTHSLIVIGCTGEDRRNSFTSRARRRGEEAVWQHMNEKTEDASICD